MGWEVKRLSMKVYNVGEMRQHIYGQVTFGQVNTNCKKKLAGKYFSDAMARWPLARGGQLAIALFSTFAVSVVQPSLKSGVRQLCWWSKEHIK